MLQDPEIYPQFMKLIKGIGRVYNREDYKLRLNDFDNGDYGNTMLLWKLWQDDAIQKYEHPVRKFKYTPVSSRKKTKEVYFCGGAYSPSHICSAKGKTCTK